MRIKDIKIGESYRRKGNQNYRAKIIKIMKPRQDENPHNHTILKCEYSQTKDDKFGLIKYFRPSDLVRAE